MRHEFICFTTGTTHAIKSIENANGYMNLSRVVFSNAFCFIIYLTISAPHHRYIFSTRKPPVTLSPFCHEIPAAVVQR